jgi:hypothetical protein
VVVENNYPHFLSCSYILLNVGWIVTSVVPIELLAFADEKDVPVVGRKQGLLGYEWKNEILENLLFLFVSIIDTSAWLRRTQQV